MSIFYRKVQKKIDNSEKIIKEYEKCEGIDMSEQVIKKMEESKIKVR